MAFQWTCPFCDRDQVVIDDNRHWELRHLHIGKAKYGDVAVTVSAVRCVNSNCNEVTLDVRFGSTTYNRAKQAHDFEPLDHWRLRPESSSKIQPDFIPLVLREDYYEACLIRDKSPKASATLSRRCLQGMIRDFCGIAKNRLIDEINELRKQVDAGSAPKGVEPEAIDAIDAVRKVGNIGAHMEKDIDLIVDVDPGEAQSLIELLEMLFEEWYVARHKRQERLAKVMAVAAEKAAVLIEAKPKPEPVAIPDGTEGE